MFSLGLAVMNKIIILIDGGGTIKKTTIYHCNKPPSVHHWGIQRNWTSANSSHGGTSINATIYSKDSFDGQESLFTLGLAIRDQDYIIQLKRGGALEKM